MKSGVASIRGVVAPLLRRDVDTETVVRVDRLMEHGRGDLGRYLFEAFRYRPDGSEDPDFILNQHHFRHSAILLAGENFGCGSSREGAVWALVDFGIRCVIAPSFADIFLNNSLQNGLAPVTLDAEEVAGIAAEVDDEHFTVTVDLVDQRISTPRGRQISFKLDPDTRDRLLSGQDDVGETLRMMDAITRYRGTMLSVTPWVFDL